MQAFDQRRGVVLSHLASGKTDKSPKGFLDAPIVSLCEYMNTLSEIYTTSSCSGRIVLCREGALDKGVEWLIASHEIVAETAVFDALVSNLSSVPEEIYKYTSEGKNSFKSVPSQASDMRYVAKNADSMTFRFEGFILAVEARTQDAATQFLKLCQMNGFRDSGITALEKRYIVNLRSSLRLDVPIVHDGKLMVSCEYLLMLTRLANEKMQKNLSNIVKFTEEVLAHSALFNKEEEMVDDDEAMQNKTVWQYICESVDTPGVLVAAADKADWGTMKLLDVTKVVPMSLETVKTMLAEKEVSLYHESDELEAFFLPEEYTARRRSMLNVTTEQWVFLPFSDAKPESVWKFLETAYTKRKRVPNAATMSAKGKARVYSAAPIAEAAKIESRQAFLVSNTWMPLPPSTLMKTSSPLDELTATPQKKRRRQTSVRTVVSSPPQLWAYIVSILITSRLFNKPMTQPDLDSSVFFASIYSQIVDIVPRKQEILGGAVLLHKDQFHKYEQIYQYVLKDLDGSARTLCISPGPDREVLDMHDGMLHSEYPLSSLRAVVSTRELCLCLCLVLKVKVVLLQYRIHHDLMRSPQVEQLASLPRIDGELLEKVTKQGNNDSDFVTSSMHALEAFLLHGSVATSSNPRTLDIEGLVLPGVAVDASTVWTLVPENGLKYILEVTHTMFSSGNTTEKARAAKYHTLYPTKNVDGEIVLDLYGGIGYFTLPMLKKGAAKHVFACEQNPYSVTALRHGALYNKLGQDKQITLLPGDNRRVQVPLLTRNSVHRVSLGLIPQSNDGWATALIALQTEGGVLHLHQNVPQGEEVAYANTVLIPTLYNIMDNLKQLEDTKIMELPSKQYVKSNLVPSYILDFPALVQYISTFSTEEELMKDIVENFSLPCLPTHTNIPSEMGYFWSSRKNSWKITLQHTEIVKSYGPKINHVVYDIAISQ